MKSRPIAISIRYASRLVSGALAVIGILCIGAVLMTSPSRALAADLSRAQAREILDEAQRAYDRGIAILRDDPSRARDEFRNAAQRFQVVIDSGVINGHLFYNLANAHLQTGDPGCVGRAILNYRRAERLIGRDARLQHNLAHARSLCRSPIPSSGRAHLVATALTWHHAPRRWRATAFLIVNAAFWGLLTFRIFRLHGWMWITWGSAIGWIALAASIAADLTGFGSRPAGVLIDDDVIVRKGNGVGFDPVFEQPVHSGLEFTLIEARGDWLQIGISNGQNGWIRARQAELVP